MDSLTVEKASSSLCLHDPVHREDHQSVGGRCLQTSVRINPLHKRPGQLLIWRSKNSAQKTIHKMLDNDPRYLRPESRAEMDQRIAALSASRKRFRKKKKTSKRTSPGARSWRDVQSSADVSSTSGSSRKAASSDPSRRPISPPTTGLRQLLIPTRSQGEGSEDTESETSSSKLLQIRQRVSDCSTSYARQVCALLRNFSISGASDSEDDGSPVAQRPSVSGGESVEEGLQEPFEAFPEPGFAVPGDFLSAHTRNCASFPGQDHGRLCWCTIFRETSSLQNSWLLPTGDLSDRARQVLRDPSDANISLTDSFGNTALHLLSALEDYQEELLAMVITSSEARTAVNTAGQTFLHVLALEWFRDLAAPSAPLRQLLAFIRNSSPDLVYRTDVYGRNFFHRLHALVRTPAILSALVSPFDPSLALRRDAFGFSPDDDGPFIPPRRPSVMMAGSPPTPTPPPSSDSDTFLAYHTQLIQVIQSSYNSPTVEDGAGRNGLHCLAEAILNPHAIMDSQRPPKRKHDNVSSPSAPSTTTTAIPASLPASGTSSGSETPLLTRLRHLESLLHSVDPNHRDRRGNTVLMAFVSHLADDQDDKSKTLLTILETLLRGGADLEARNRHGETALLVAARLGRKVALTTLLEHGANVHARDVYGRGVLGLLDTTCRAARHDLALYARLEACRVLLTGRRDWGVVLEPSVAREWSR